MAWLAPGFHQISASPAARRIEEAGRAFEAKRSAERSQAQKRERARESKRLCEKWGLRLKLTPQVEVVPIGHGPLHQIMDEVCAKHGVTIADLRSLRRWAPLREAKGEFYYRAVAETNCSFPEIARVLKKDHTTVMGGAQSYARRNNIPLPRGMVPGSRG